VPLALPDPVNTDSTNDEHPAISSDGKRLYFTSNRRSGYGGSDIWVAYSGSYQPRITQGYAKWIKTGELEKALYVYDLKEGPNGIIYAATACADSGPKGKVFKTNNGGLTWTPCGDLPGSMTVYT
jgi:hypothetical protein